MTHFALFVPGKPIPQGSMRGYVRPGKTTGRPVVAITNSNPALNAWRMKITGHAIDAQLEWAALNPGAVFPIGDPIGIKVDFVLTRPKDHFGTGKNAAKIVPSAPVHPAKTPDLDKLLRAILDGFTDAQVWRDDAQVVFCQVAKHFVDSDPRWTQEGVVIEFGRMP